MNEQAHHIIKAKKFIGELENLSACPTRLDQKLFKTKLAEISVELGEVWKILEVGEK